jgi:hypothetical protein
MRTLGQSVPAPNRFCIVRLELFWSELAWAKCIAILTWRFTSLTLEDLGKVGLIREARIQCDARQRFLRSSQLSAGKIDSQLPRVFANGVPLTPTEFARQINRVRINHNGQATETNRFGKMCFEILLCEFNAARWNRSRKEIAHGLGYQF